MQKRTLFTSQRRFNPEPIPQGVGDLKFLPELLFDSELVDRFPQFLMGAFSPPWQIHVPRELVSSAERPTNSLNGIGHVRYLAAFSSASFFATNSKYSEGVTKGQP